MSFTGLQYPFVTSIISIFIVMPHFIITHRSMFIFVAQISQLQFEISIWFTRTKSTRLRKTSISNFVQMENIRQAFDLYFHCVLNLSDLLTISVPFIIIPLQMPIYLSSVNVICHGMTFKRLFFFSFVIVALHKELSMRIQVGRRNK